LDDVVAVAAALVFDGFRRRLGRERVVVHLVAGAARGGVAVVGVVVAAALTGLEQVHDGGVGHGRPRRGRPDRGRLAEDRGRLGVARQHARDEVGLLGTLEPFLLFLLPGLLFGDDLGPLGGGG